MQWYAIHTKPRHEKIAVSNLDRLGVETFFPQLRRTKSIRRKKQTVVGPLFSGYLFARFNPDRHFRAVNYARGVHRVVTFGAVPATVDEEMIDSIKSRLQGGCVTAPPLFTAGQTVRIQTGPLRGLEAVFERELGDHQRVALLMQVMSRQARVVVDLEQVSNL